MRRVRLDLSATAGNRRPLPEQSSLTPLFPGDRAAGRGAVPAVEAEGEGDTSIAEWRAGHAGFWEPLGYPVHGDQLLYWQRFRHW
jgi:hypothetical protein